LLNISIGNHDCRTQDKYLNRHANYMMISDIAAPSPNIRFDEIWELFETYLVARLFSARQYQSYSFHFKRHLS